MKRFLVIALILTVMLTGCGKKEKHIDSISHDIMGGEQITVPDVLSGFSKAVIEATDAAINTAVNDVLKKKPEFISFEFSSDVMLSAEEKAALKETFSAYGTEISDGLRSSLSEIELGITVGYDSVQRLQTSDCDLTIPVKIYYGKNIYTYCADFKIYGNDYVLFRFEYLNRTRYQY